MYSFLSPTPLSLSLSLSLCSCFSISISLFSLFLSLSLFFSTVFCFDKLRPFSWIYKYRSKNYRKHFKIRYSSPAKLTWYSHSAGNAIICKLILLEILSLLAFNEITFDFLSVLDHRHSSVSIQHHAEQLHSAGPVSTGGCYPKYASTGERLFL